MSWDDEDFDVGNNNAAASWEDEALDDDPVLDSWDIDEEEVERQKKEAAAKKKAELDELHKKQAEAKAKKLAAKNGKDPVLLEIDKVDPKTRAEMLRKAELNSDLNNAASLFGDLSVVDESFDINAHPRERATQAAAAKAKANSATTLTKDSPLELHPIFKPESKQDFEKLRKTLSSTLTKLAEESSLNYSSSLAIDLIRDLCQPLSIENTRKVTSTLSIIIKDKEKAERQARLSKAGGTSTGGAGKKKAKPAVKTNVNSSFKKDVFDDMNNNYDDFGDDDFM
ncbi:eukaryotic translation initiation factor 3 subunit J [[Candida] jaroonii]|uniref:Eukaryotic translation initiation factor 3 subunit J n=1 Tax=[Candida] jaroonii TaxID=467808 RepID=A0ACA9YG73_9ASCO|nr:eukaryotic translation initiation factor 3 subunit J [[Candida] jaroonii]